MIKQFDITVRASLDRETTHLELTYRGQRVSQKLADELANTMEVAVEYILRFGGASSTETEALTDDESFEGSNHAESASSFSEGSGDFRSKSAADGFLRYLTAANNKEMNGNTGGVR